MNQVLDSITEAISVAEPIFDFVAEQAGRWAVVKLTYPLGTMHEVTVLNVLEEMPAACANVPGWDSQSRAVSLERTELLGGRGEYTYSYWTWNN